MVIEWSFKARACDRACRPRGGLDAASGAFAVLDVKGFPLLSQWYAFYPRGKRLSTVTQAFLEYLVAEGEG